VNAPKDAVEVPQRISYSTKQAAAATGIAESTRRQLIRQGTRAARYLGSTILIDAGDLARFYRSLPSERQVERECAANRGAA